MSETESTTTTTTSTRVPVIVDYCKVCGFPKEYCEYSPSAATCLKTNGPFLKPGEQVSTDNNNNNTSSDNTTTTTTTTTSTNEIQSKLQETKIIDDSKEGEAEGTATTTTSSKKKKEKTNSIVIEVLQRNKRKHVTKIQGLDSYGIKLSDATKVMAKKFSCGCSVVKSPTGEEIDIQGDFQEESIDLILEKWPIVQVEEIYAMIDKKKVRARK